MAQKKKIRIIYAAGIHAGGGLFVLNHLKKKMNFNKDIIYLDERNEDSGFFKKFEMYLIKNNIFSKIFSEYTIKKKINKNIKEIIFLNGLPPIFRYKTKVTTYFQNANILKFKSNIMKMMSSDIFRSLKFFLFKNNVDKWVVFSKYAKNDLMNIIKKEKIFKEKIVFEIRKKKFQKLEYDFIYPASGENHKNHKNLLKAFIILAELKIFPKLLITLRKEDFNKLNFIYYINKFNLKITNKPEKNRKKFLTNYNKSKALIFPSNTETLGLPLIEARKFKIDILASNRKFSKEYTIKKRLFNPKDPKDIANTIIRYLQSKKN